MSNQPITLDEIIASYGRQAAETIVREQVQQVSLVSSLLTPDAPREIRDVVMLTVVRSAVSSLCLFALGLSFLCQHPPAQGVQSALRLLNKEQVT